MVKVVGQDNKVTVIGDPSKVLIDPVLVINGKDGANGKDGPEGPAGRNGLNGQDGRDGKDGRDGIDGKDGKDGFSFWIEFDEKKNVLKFKNNGGLKNPKDIKLPDEKAWGFGIGGKRVIGGGGQLPADWNQTDPNDPTFIKNKPTSFVEFKVVQQLPLTGKSGVIYLVADPDHEGKYVEWVWVKYQDEPIVMYKWEKLGYDIDVGGASITIGTVTDTLVNHLTTIKNDIDGLGDSISDLQEDKEDLFRYTTMPTADSTNAGKIVEFIGTTDATYTNGYFYKCNLVTLVAPVEESITVTQTAGESLGSFTTDVSVFRNALNPNREWTYQFSCVGKPSQISLSRFKNGFEFTSLTRDTVFDNSRLHYYSWVDGSNNYYYTTTEVPSSDTIFYVGSTDDLSQPTNVNSGWEYVATNTRRTDDPWGMWIIGSSDEEVSLSDYGIYSSSRGVVGDVLQVHYYPQVLGETAYQWQQHNVQPEGASEIDDTTTSLTKTWSSSKINGIIGNIETALDTIRGV